ncbi:MAG: FtsX-like permease family protein [Bacteroidota bacterium]
MTSQLTDEAEINGDQNTVDYLSIIALFILILACVNYVNLSTAKSVERAREVGLRKVVGSQRGQLIIHFLVESALVFLFSSVVAFIIVFFASPLINSVGGTPSSYLIWEQGWFWFSVFVFWIVGSAISGFYPALVLSSFPPVTVLKGQFKGKGEGASLRKTLVIFQFAVSVVLIIGTFVVYDQMIYMQNKDLGFSTEQIMVVERPSKRDTSRTVARNDYLSFRTGLSDEPSVLGVAGSGMLPGKKLRFKTQIRRLDQAPEDAISFFGSSMDYDFQDLMEMELLAGRTFSRNFVKDPDTAIVINKAGMMALGYTEPEELVGRYVSIDRWQWKPQVVGVIDDFHNESMKESIQPIAFFLQEYHHEYLMVKMSTNNMAETIDAVENQWNQSFAGNPFEYFFLDDYFNSYYEAEKSFRDLFLIFTVLAVLIGCLGLFGLSSYIAIQRTKEIGIRKVLGSSIPGILRLMFKDFLILIGIANLIAWPLSWYFLSRWLENYPYHVEVNWFFFVAATVVVIVIAFLTISFNTLKTARLNPAKTLKYE